MYGCGASVSELDTSGANLHCLSDFSCRQSKAICADQLSAGHRALHGLLGSDGFSSDDTIRSLFLRFGMGEVQRFFDPMTEWMMERLPQSAEGHSLDLDSTVFERLGDNR